MARHPIARWGPRSGGMPRVITPITSAYTTPLQSAYPSTYASEAETEAEADAEGDATTKEANKLSLASLTIDTPLRPLRPKRRVPSTPFHFLMLPSELRLKIYEYYFDGADDVFDLGPGNYKLVHKRLGLMRTCRQVHAEATHFFYGTRTFRLFPTFPGKYFKSKKPLLARMKPIHRQCMQSLQLWLGIGWNAPPKGWTVNDALGLADCVNMRKLQVFVEFDPGNAYFKDFRRSDGFYEGFSRQLLTDVINGLPALEEVEFDAWPSVKKSGNMVHGLLDVVAQTDLEVSWGPKNSWNIGNDAYNEKLQTGDDLEAERALAMGLIPANIVAVA